MPATERQQQRRAERQALQRAKEHALRIERGGTPEYFAWMMRNPWDPNGPPSPPNKYLHSDYQVPSGLYNFRLWTYRVVKKELVSEEDIQIWSEWAGGKDVDTFIHQPGETSPLLCGRPSTHA